MHNLNSIQNNPYINNNAQDKAEDNHSNANNVQNNAQNLNQNNVSNNASYNANANMQNTPNPLANFINSGNSGNDFLKGAAIGAPATIILTNPGAQKAIFKGFAKLSSLFELGFEEMKERYEDAKAEVQAEDSE